MCYPPTPKKKVPPPEKRGRELKTRFEDYFTEQLKLLLLHSVCSRSLRIAAKPSFQCLIWNPTEMNCQFWFHAQVHFSSFKSCAYKCPPLPSPAGIHQRDAKLTDRIDVKGKIMNSWIKVLFTVVKPIQIFQIHPCVIRMHGSEILHQMFCRPTFTNISISIFSSIYPFAPFYIPIIRMFPNCLFIRKLFGLILETQNGNGKKKKTEVLPNTITILRPLQFSILVKCSKGESQFSGGNIHHLKAGWEPM